MTEPATTAGGIILRLPELVSIALALIACMGILGKVIHALWQDNKKLSDTTLSLAKEAMPLLALQGKILEQHNQLDQTRAQHTQSMMSLTESLQEAVKIVSAMQAKCALMLKMVGHSEEGTGP